MRPNTSEGCTIATEVRGKFEESWLELAAWRLGDCSRSGLTEWSPATNGGRAGRATRVLPGTLQYFEHYNCLVIPSLLSFLP